jgi:ankyrin repeat protein
LGGLSLLHWDVREPNSDSTLETVELILKYKPNINAKTNFGNAALIELVENKNLKEIKLLLKYGVKINVKDFKNKSTIDICIERYKFNSEITHILLTRNKNIDYKFSNYLDFNFIYKN